MSQNRPKATQPGAVTFSVFAAQAVIMVVVLVVVVAAMIVEPASSESPYLWSAVGLLVLTTILAAVVPWASLDRSWGIIVPLLDIVGISVMREGTPDLRVGVLLVFPLVWISFTFSLRANLLTLGGTLAGIWGTHFLGIELPAVGGMHDFPSVVMLPILLIFVVTAGYLEARRRRAQSRLLREQSAQLEAALGKARNQEQTLDEMLNAVDFAVIGFDRRGEIAFVNDAHRTSMVNFGLPADSVMFPVVYQADRVTPYEQEHRPLIRALAGHSFEDVVIWVGEPGERQVAFSTSARPLRDRSGDSDGGILVLQDVTAQIEAELVIRRELDRASEVQRALLPKSAPPLEGYEAAGACVPAKFVGGDFFDWYPIDGGVAVTLADVMGKGIGAGIIAATVRSTIRSARRDDDVVAAVGRASVALADDLSQARSFVTLFHARLRLEDGCVSFVDAGHGLTLIVKADGTAERLSTTDLPLGVLADDEWTAHEIFLEHGATLVSFSDGVLELFDGSLDSADRVAEIVRASSSASEVVGRIERLAHGDHAPDDVTVIAIRRLPSVSVPES